jgi:hypothetical protein
MKNFRTLSITIGLLGLSVFIYTLQAMNLKEQIHAQQQQLNPPQVQPSSHQDNERSNMIVGARQFFKEQYKGNTESMPNNPNQTKGEYYQEHKKLVPSVVTEFNKLSPEEKVLWANKEQAAQKNKEDAERNRLAQLAKEKEEAERLALEKKRKQMDEIEVDLSVKPKVKTNLSEEEIFAAMQKKQREDVNAELEQVKNLGVATKTLADEEKVNTLSKPFIKEGPERAPAEESAGMSTAKKAAIAGTATAGLAAAGAAALGATALGGLVAAEVGGGAGPAAVGATADVGVTLGDDIAGSAIGFEEV